MTTEQRQLFSVSDSVNNRQSRTTQADASSTKRDREPAVTSDVSDPELSRMQRNTEAKLKNLLKLQKIQLWNPPYTQDQGPGPEHMQELAEIFAPLLDMSTLEVAEGLESIRIQSVQRGQGNKMFRETSVATLELLLPRDARKDQKQRTFLETRLDVLVQVLVDQIGEKFGMKTVKLILGGKTLCADQPLDQQGVKNHSRIMVLKLSEDQERVQDQGREDQSVQRSLKGFKILSDRERSEDQESTPYLEIADQKGNVLKIPEKERKALTLAMSLHEKGRALMKRKLYEQAVAHLLQADLHFSECGSELLRSVDNSALLQLDIVWCYRALEALCCLDDARSRLQRAEENFKQCYGEEQQRLMRIKGNTGREEVLFLRLSLLQCLLCYIQGDDGAASCHLLKVESLYQRVCIDSEKLCQLMSLGFTERESRLGLRASQGDVEQAAAHITSRREEKEELKKKERHKRTSRSRKIASLMELGFSRRDVIRAMDQSDGDADQAYLILSSSCSSDASVSPDLLEQLLYLGFDRSESEAALRMAAGDVQTATQLLLDNQGEVSSGSSTSSPSVEESSSSSSTTEETALLNEVLEDICHHEDDYLDETLDEERELMTSLKNHLGARDTMPSSSRSTRK